MNLKKSTALAFGALLLPLAVLAQNVATVNGKPVPQTRVDALLKNATKSGQPVTPELTQQAKEQVVLREIWAQEAEKQGIMKTQDYKDKVELMRQTILIQGLFENYAKTVKPTDAEIRAEYDRIKAAQSGTEYHARHILVDNEAEAKKLIADIKAGAKFEDVAKKNSKDTGTAENGGDLDFAKPDNYVPEFSAALVKLKKGEMTDTPVHTQFGWHIIKLEDTRQAQFPTFEEVKGRIADHIVQEKVAAYQMSLRDKAKTDFKFAKEDAPAAPAAAASAAATPAKKK
jgi:peptidyl-prolyl cis-trans isomerase C